MTSVSIRLAFSLYFCNQFNSTLIQADDCLSQVQQYTNNELRALRRSGLRIQILTTIISDGFKEFNSTLTETKIQTRSNSKYLRRLLVQSWEHCC